MTLELLPRIDGIEYLESLRYIDSHRVGRYGGVIALMSLFHSDTYACGAALRAVTSGESIALAAAFFGRMSQE